MWNHAPQMNSLTIAQSVPYPYFEPQELADVLAYLGSLPTAPPGNPAAGERTLKEKGCTGCHALHPGESSAGPNLIQPQLELTPASIATTMWNHGPKMLQLMESSAIAWPTFNSQEVANMLAFLESIRRSGSPSTPAGGQP